MRVFKSRNCVFAVITVLSAFTLPTAWAQGTPNNPVPYVDQPLVPTSAAPAGSAFTLTVNGAGFVSGSTVNWNGSSRTTTFVNATQLTAQIKAADIAVPGTASVTVVNPTPGGGVSNVVFFQIIKSSAQVSLTNSNVAVGTSPAAVFTADFIGSGVQDLAVANQGSNTVSILLGIGNGSFQPHVDYATGLGPQEVVAGDFNDNGILDLATVNAGENSQGNPANTVSILLGNGDGTFQTHADYATGQLPVDLVTGDFNRDGFLDVATVNEDSQSVSILLGNGDGTLQPHVDYSVSSLPMGLATADFNGDGILDLAVVNYLAHTVSILLGNGDGTFQSAVNYPAPTHPLGVVAADFNGDGNQDLAVATFGTSAVAVLLGNGDGTFGSYVKYPTGAFPQSVVTGDFNADGKLDLAVSNDTGLGSVSVLLGNGDGTFQSAVNFPSGLLPIGMSTGDFNGDGMLDLAAADLNGNTASIMLQTTVLFAPTSITFAGQALGTTSAAQTVTVTNTGNSNLIISSVSTALPFAETNTCSTPVAPGSSCTVSVTFSPTTPGTASGSLSLTDGAIGSPQVVSLAGSGSGPFVSLSPNSLNFGSIQVNQNSSAQTVTLTNTGTSTLTISSVTVNPTTNYSVTNLCGSTLTAGAGCNINVTFSPASSGTLPGTLSIADNAIGSPQIATLTGVGIQGVATLSPTSLTFPTQLINTTSPAQIVTLTNTGTAALTINKVSATGPFAETNTCGSSVAMNASCTISVTFTPTTGGTPTGTVTVNDNGLNSPQTVTLNGTGTILSVSPLILTWGTITLGQSGSAQTVILSNLGTYSVSSLGASIIGANFADYSDTTTCALVLSAGTSCSYSITFTPSAPGVRSASLSISYSASAGGSPQAVSLSGVGGKITSPAVTFAPSSLGFGSVNVGSSSTLGLILTNSGGSTLTVTNVATGGDYSQTNTCTASLPPGQNCSISVTLMPSFMGTDNGMLTVTDNATGSPQAVSLTSVGLQPQAVPAPSSLTFATQLINTNSPSQTVTLTNTGNTALSITKIMITPSTSYSQTNTCGSSLNTNASCTITATFSPANAGTVTGTITVTDNAPTGPQTVSLTGTGTTLSVAPLAVAWGTVSLGTSGSPMVVTLINKGTFTISSLSASISGANAAEFSDSTGSSCTSSLSAGAMCIYSVTFTPAASGLRTAALSISYASAGGGSPQTVSLMGTGGNAGPPTVSLAPSSLAFGSVNVGSNSTLGLTLTNTGGSNLTVTNVATGGDYSQINTCTASLPPGQNCSISVTFVPSIMGTDNGTLTVTDNAGNSPQGVSLTGVGLQPQAVPAPTSLAFATQVINTTSPAQTVTLMNTGNTTLSITKITATSVFAETNNCGASLNTNASCTISVTFTPTGAGTPTGTITITDNAPTSPQTVSLSGTGTSLSVSPLALVWGIVNLGMSGTPQTVTLINKGTSTIGSLSATIGGANAADFSDATGSSCASSLSAGAMCIYSVTFTPAASGVRTAALSISYGSSGGGSPQTVSLVGTGGGPGPPTATFTPSSLAFGSVNVGSNSTLGLTLTNTGASNLTVTNVASGGDYSVTNTCAVAIPPGQTCAISVTFMPSIMGTDNGTLTVADNASNSPQSVSLMGTGLQPKVTLSPTSLTFATQVINTISPVQTVTLTNSGNATLSITRITIANSVFAQTNTCGSSLNANASCTFSVTFTPTGAGTPTGTITITDSAPTSPQTVSLSGTGTTMSVSPLSLSWGTVKVGQSGSSQVITLSNKATFNVGSLSATITGADPADFSDITTCTGTLSAGASCTYTVTFTPIAIGSRTASLSISYGATGGGSPQNVALSGTGN